MEKAKRQGLLSPTSPKITLTKERSGKEARVRNGCTLISLYYLLLRLFLNEKTVSGPRGLFEGNVFKNSATYIKAYTAMDICKKIRNSKLILTARR